MDLIQKIVFPLFLSLLFNFDFVSSVKISGKQYNVGGDVTIEGDKVMIKGFSYTGAAPDAFFYIGTKGSPETADQHGRLIQYPAGSSAPLTAFTGQDVEFNLPVGVAGANVTWVSVWCRAYSVDFGHAWLTDNIPASSSTNIISYLTIFFSLGLSHALLESWI